LFLARLATIDQQLAENSPHDTVLKARGVYGLMKNARFISGNRFTDTGTAG
jgi:hypothetical protein